MPSFPTIKSGDPQGLVFESPPEPVESLSPWSDFCLRESEPLRVESDGKSEPNCLIEGGVPIVLSTDFSIDFPLAWQC